MKGLNLTDVIKHFGFEIGFPFWFKMSITDPIRIFWWKYIVARPLCTEHGYFLCKSDCKYKKITGRRNIYWYEKVRHLLIQKELETIEEGKNGNCIYCNEEPGTELIDDPNGSLSKWKVCKNCKDVVGWQQQLSFGCISNNNELIKEAHNELYKISQRTGKPIISAMVDSSGVSSVEFTGEKDQPNKE